MRSFTHSAAGHRNGAALLPQRPSALLSPGTARGQSRAADRLSSATTLVLVSSSSRDDARLVQVRACAGTSTSSLGISVSPRAAAAARIAAQDLVACSTSAHTVACCPSVHGHAGGALDATRAGAGERAHRHAQAGGPAAGEPASADEHAVRVPGGRLMASSAARRADAAHQRCCAGPPRLHRKACILLLPTQAPCRHRCSRQRCPPHWQRPPRAPLFNPPRLQRPMHRPGSRQALSSSSSQRVQARPPAP